jgi:hypothetical protein
MMCVIENRGRSITERRQRRKVGSNLKVKVKNEPGDKE